MNEVIQKMDKMTDEERHRFMGDLKDGGDGYEEPDPADDKPERPEPEPQKADEVGAKDWDESEGPPAEEPADTGDDDFLSLDPESFPEDQRRRIKKAQDAARRVIERATEKERGADKKFREAAEIRKRQQYEEPPAQPEPPKEPWYKRHGLKPEDAQVFRDFFMEEIAPQQAPIFEEFLTTKEESIMEKLRNKYTEDKGYPDFSKYEEQVIALAREVPGLTYEEAYRDLAFDDVSERTKSQTGKKEQDIKLRHEQERRAKTHYFEGSSPPSNRTGNGRPPEPTRWTPQTMRKHQDELLKSDPSGKELDRFMAELEEKI